MKHVYLTMSVLGSLLVSLSSTTVRAQDYGDLSPRAFCRATGGIVSETAQQNIYLCCYEERKKCVLSDTDQEVSWHISLQVKEGQKI